MIIVMMIRAIRNNNIRRGCKFILSMTFNIIKFGWLIISFFYCFLLIIFNFIIGINIFNILKFYK